MVVGSVKLEWIGIGMDVRLCFLYLEPKIDEMSSIVAVSLAGMPNQAVPHDGAETAKCETILRRH